MNSKLINCSLVKRQKIKTMKKYLLKFTVVLFLVMTAPFVSSAQFVVKMRPPAPVITVHPVAPGPRHVWVNGEYVWRGGQYVYTEGYWALPPARRNHWVEGRWKYRRGGWFWIPGHWR